MEVQAVSFIFGASAPIFLVVLNMEKHIMSMIFAESQLQQFKEFVCLTVATKLGIKDTDLKSVPELRALILGKNQSIAAVLAAFLSSYEEWYQFHVRIDAADKAGNLDASQNTELMQLINERDGTRNNLLKGLAAATIF